MLTPEGALPSFPPSNLKAPDSSPAFPQLSSHPFLFLFGLSALSTTFEVISSHLESNSCLLSLSFWGRLLRTLLAEPELRACEGDLFWESSNGLASPMTTPTCFPPPNPYFSSLEKFELCGP